VGGYFRPTFIKGSYCQIYNETKTIGEAANEILREREKDRERKRLGLTLEEYETMETEDPNRVA
jgi:hypothetical protein